MTGLKDFRSYFTSFISLVGAGVASTALVLVTALIGLSPPWPTAIVQITAVAQLLVLIFVYQHLNRSGRKVVSRYMKMNLALLLIFFIGYLSSHSLFVYDLPNGDGAVRGINCTDNAKILYSSSCPLLEEVQIADAEYEDDRLWTPLGLLLSRLILLIGWIGSFVCLVNIFAAFVAFQRRQAAR